MAIPTIVLSRIPINMQHGNVSLYYAIKCYDGISFGGWFKS
jgi:hypothetical protein